MSISLSLQIDQTDFGLDIEFLLKGIENPIVKAYLNYQIDIAVQFGADKERAEKEMMDALEFEIGLANVKLNFKKLTPINFCLSLFSPTAIRFH